MPPMSRENLRWVHRNRQPRDRAVAVGRLAEQIVGDRVQPAGRRVEAIQRVLVEMVDEEFIAHCTLGPLEGGRLTLLVDDPAWAYALRQRWLVPLLERLRSARGSVRVTSLCFSAGKSELKVIPEVPK
ncbi:MAG: DciA family protein [Phycisphaerae bacterium]